MSRAMDSDFVPANDGLDWLYRLDVRLCTDTTLDGRFVEQILATFLKLHDGDSLKRVGDVLDRRPRCWTSSRCSAKCSTWFAIYCRTRTRQPLTARCDAKADNVKSISNNASPMGSTTAPRDRRTTPPIPPN